MKKVKKVSLLTAVFISGMVSLAHATVTLPLFELFTPKIEEETDGSYHMRLLEVGKAWGLTQGSPAIKVALITTGANYKLDTLKSNIALNHSEMHGKNGIDDDGNGYIDDIYGTNTYLGTGDPMDFHGLGTYVASLVGGVDVGLLKEVSIIPINPFNDQGLGTTESTVKAIQYAISRRAKIVELGFGSGSKAEALCAAIEEGGKHDVLFIATAGNGGQDIDGENTIYPAACPSDNLLVGTTTDQNDELALYASWGVRRVHVAAPGDFLTGFNHLGQPKKYRGGSVSNGVTTAVATLALSANPALTYKQLKEVLMYSVDPIPALSGKVSSGGRLNAFSAVRLARSIPR
ncbi:MAG: S8 family serine peptidase [Deltaproteobacteria bacterium]|nr:S8 family serine peptidase [Deltaproteobacteria bacterium]